METQQSRITLRTVDAIWCGPLTEPGHGVTSRLMREEVKINP